MKKSFGQKICMKCGTPFQTDLRGGAKWCFPCKSVVNREHRRLSRNRVNPDKVSFYGVNS